MSQNHQNKAMPRPLSLHPHAAAASSRQLAGNQLSQIRFLSQHFVGSSIVKSIRVENKPPRGLGAQLPSSY